MSLEEEDEEDSDEEDSEQGGPDDGPPAEGPGRPAGRRLRFVWAGDEALTREWISAAAAAGD